MSDTLKTAALIIIGNEILSGRTKDKNAGYIAEKMTEIGITMQEIRVIPDVEATIIETVNLLRAQFDYIFTTGGIGPTHDDITAACVAKAFDVPIEQNEDAYNILLAHYGHDEFNEARQRMAQIPVGATLINNPVSAAPGFRMGNVHVMAGVPKIMQAMLDSIIPTLIGGTPVKSITITCTLPESKIAIGLGNIQAQYPDIDIGSYPYFFAGNTGVSAVLRSTDSDKLEQASEAVSKMIEECGGTPKRL